MQCIDLAGVVVYDTTLPPVDAKTKSVVCVMLLMVTYRLTEQEV